MNPQLPPLPEPEGVIYLQDRPYDRGWATSEDAYSSAQMTAYGLQCADAERARCVAICGEVMQEELDRRQHYASSVAGVCGIRISNPSMQDK